MVPNINTVTNSSTSTSAHAPEQCALTVQPETPSSTGKTQTYGLSLIRQSPESKGISSEAQGTILNSWQSGTQKQYRVCLDKCNYM